MSVAVEKRRYLSRVRYSTDQSSPCWKTSREREREGGGGGGGGGGERKKPDDPHSPFPFPSHYGQSSDVLHKSTMCFTGFSSSKKRGRCKVPFETTIWFAGSLIETPKFPPARLHDPALASRDSQGYVEEIGEQCGASMYFDGCSQSTNYPRVTKRDR